MKRLSGKVALVTGAGRGIGRETAIQLAREGAFVVVNDLDTEPTEDTAAFIGEDGGTAVAVPGSITDPAFADAFVKAAISAYGDIHIIVNAAGYTWDSVIQNMSDAQFDAMIDVHLKAPWRILKTAFAFLREKVAEERSRGEAVVRKVVNVSSVAGTRGNAGQANYASAKAGVAGLTRTLSKEWGRYNITVNCVAFGFIETRLTQATDEKKMITVDGKDVPVGVPVANIAAIRQAIPLGRGGTPAEAAGAILMLCFPEADYVSGQIIEVTGGF